MRTADASAALGGAAAGVLLLLHDHALRGWRRLQHGKSSVSPYVIYLEATGLSHLSRGKMTFDERFVVHRMIMPSEGGDAFSMVSHLSRPMSFISRQDD